jgi:uncharacterized protein YkwD
MTGTTGRGHGARIATAVLLAATLGALVVTVPAGASPLRVSAAPAAGPERLRVGEDAWQLLKLTNAARERRGLTKLQLDREASRIARRHSAAMAAAGELFHTTDVTPYLDGIDWHRWGENVGYTPGSVDGLQDAFMDSEPHRHNVLEPGFRRVAIGTVRVDGVLWVTLFFYG